MKHYIVLFALLMISGYTYSQNTSFLSSGFLMSADVGYSRINESDWDANGLSTQLNAVTQRSQIGFSIGTVFRFRLSERIHLVPQAVLAFQSSRLDYDLTNDILVQQEIEPVSVELPIHLEFNKSIGTKTSLTSILGARYQRDFSKRPVANFLGLSRDNVSLDLGIGLIRALPKFNIQPQLLFSLGLLNLNNSNNNLFNEALTGLRQDRISFRILFFG